ncbi:MAG TPA: hypothetical protein VJ944_04935 [Thermoplasmataceae archaeon]|nr:hypothetical protein [Thermoplasmataceae archaeon]
MEKDEVKGLRRSHFRSNLVWNLIAIISIIATILAFYSQRMYYSDPINGAATLRYNIFMSFFLLLIPVLWLLGIRIKWMAITLQIIPILLFLVGIVDGSRLIAFWPASLINYSLVYKFFQKGTSSTSG